MSEDSTDVRREWGDPPMPPAPPSAESLRLTYHYDGTEIHLVAQDRVDVVVLNAVVTEAPIAAHVVDVQRSDGTALARVPVRADLTETIEVFGLPGEPIIRVPDPHPTGAFSVVVPLPPDAARVLLKRLAAVPSASAAAGTTSLARQAAPVVLSDDRIER